MKDHILKEFLEEGLDDWIMDQTAHGIANEEPDAADEEAPPVTYDKFKTIKALKELFDSGLFVPGFPGEEGFCAWETPRESWMDSIIDIYELHKWRSYGAGFWLNITKRGELLALKTLH